MNIRIGTFLIVFVSFFFGGNTYAEWQDPTSAPPLGNIDAPINIGATEQRKSGKLIIEDELSANGGLSVSGAALFGDYVNISAALTVHGDVTFSTGPTEDFFYDSATGNIGIGTSSPSYPLTVVGDVNVTGRYCINGVCVSDLSGVGGAGGSNFWKMTALNDGIYASSTSWNVGIGTTTPSARLHVVGDGSAPFKLYNDGGVSAVDHDIATFYRFAPGTGNAGFGVGYKGTGSDVQYTYMYAPGARDFALRTYDTGSASPKLYIQNSGNIGIGTTTPLEKLSINGVVYLTSQASAPAVTTNRLYSIQNGANNDLYWSGTKLNGGGGGGGIGGGGNQDYIAKFTSANNIGNSIITDTGTNVGIGTTNPGAKLEINGQVKITGGSPGLGKILTSDATGLATWTPGLPTCATYGEWAMWNGTGWVCSGETGLPPGVNDKLVFVTKATYRGSYQPNVGIFGSTQTGVAAGDTICQNVADAACLVTSPWLCGRTFKSWLSQGAPTTTDARTNVQCSDGKRYVMRLDNQYVTVANNCTDLVTRNSPGSSIYLRHAINAGEDGVIIAGGVVSTRVWTGTRETGLRTGGDQCNNWDTITNNGTTLFFAEQGLLDSISAGWTAYQSDSCNAKNSGYDAHLYCFEI